MSILQAIKKPLHTTEHQFAIRKVRVGKDEKMMPVCKEPGFMPQWRPIVKLYDRYLVMDYDRPEGFTKRECEAHITGFKKQVEADKLDTTRSEEWELIT